MIKNNLRASIWAMLPSQSLHEVSVWIHQVKVDAMVHQVILSGFDVLRRAEVYPVRLAHVLDLVVCARQPDQRRVELGKVAFQSGRAITLRVACDEDGANRVRSLLIDNVEHAS